MLAACATSPSAQKANAIWRQLIEFLSGRKVEVSKPHDFWSLGSLDLSGSYDLMIEAIANTLHRDEVAHRPGCAHEEISKFAQLVCSHLVRF